MLQGCFSISMLLFNGVRHYFQVLRHGAMDYFQLCKLYGTTNYFSIFSRISYGTNDYFSDFCAGPKIIFPIFERDYRKFSRFLEPCFPIGYDVIYDVLVWSGVACLLSHAAILICSLFSNQNKMADSCFEAAVVCIISHSLFANFGFVDSLFLWKQHSLVT